MTVVFDSEEITNLVNNLQQSSNSITSNSLIKILSTANQNMIGQVISSLSQQLNKINSQTVETAATS